MSGHTEILARSFSMSTLTFRYLAKYGSRMREMIQITKALADPNRVRIVLALRKQELCVCQIVELLQLAPSTISKHLSILNHAGLILTRKTERWVYCRLQGRDAPVVVREAVDWVNKSLAQSSTATSDRKKLKQILRMSPATLCKRQK